MVRPEPRLTAPLATTSISRSERMTPPERPSETGVCGASCGCAAGDSPGATTVDSNRNGASATSRRRFLQVLGTSGAGAAAAAACGPPDFADKMIPHLVQDDTITPGVSDTYATVLHGGPTEVPVHARVRDGRVLTVAPNERFPGGTQGLSSPEPLGAAGPLRPGPPVGPAPRQPPERPVGVGRRELGRGHAGVHRGGSRGPRDLPCS